jgi:hypothetical protein
MRVVGGELASSGGGGDAELSSSASLFSGMVAKTRESVTRTLPSGSSGFAVAEIGVKLANPRCIIEDFCSTDQADGHIVNV